MPANRAAAGQHTSAQHTAVQTWRFEHLETVDSTNSEAMRRAVAGERGPLWIQADRQTRGRGRSGRQWKSAEGNLAVSLIFSPRCEAHRLPQLSLLAGIAAHDLLAGLARPEAPDGAGGRIDDFPPVRLKWPNDILIGNAKVGGVLIESSRLGADLVCVIGLGLNLASAPDLADYPVTCLKQHFSGDLSPRRLAGALAPVMHGWLALWAGGVGFGEIRDAWLARALEPGCRISVHAEGQPVTGAFDGIDENGALILRMENGAVRRFTFGDVAIVPADDGQSG